MRSLFLKSIPAIVGLCAVMLTTIPSEARTSFDGKWFVHAAANRGSCSDDYGMAINITNGRVAYHGLLAAFATGNVTGSGQLVLKIGEARVSGQLAPASGGGYWASPNCKGTWTAVRL